MTNFSQNIAVIAAAMVVIAFGCSGSKKAQITERRELSAGKDYTIKFIPASSDNEPRLDSTIMQQIHSSIFFPRKDGPQYPNPFSPPGQIEIDVSSQDSILGVTMDNSGTICCEIKILCSEKRGRIIIQYDELTQCSLRRSDAYFFIRNDSLIRSGTIPR